MNLCEIIPIFQPIKIDLIGERREESQEILEIWEEESKQREIANRKIISLVRIREGTLMCEIVDYRMFLAQLKRPDLISHLRVCPVAVAGIVSFQRRYLVGKRSKSVSQFQGMYEFVPSGTLDAEDPIPDHQILKELHEEAGIPLFQVKEITQKCLVRMFIPSLLDVFYTIDAMTDHITKNEEYSELHWLGKNQVLDSQEKNCWMPGSRQIFQYLNLKIAL